MSERPTVLIVDDTATNLTLLMGLLKGDYRVKVANNGSKAIELATSSPPDLVLLDVMMPGMDGYEVCRILQTDERTKHVPIIFLTAKNSVEDEKQGFDVGAVDFIHKPISPPLVMARVKTHLRIKEWQDSLRKNNSWLEKEVNRRLSQINQLQNATIYVMVSLAEFRDECTGNHIRRTQAYVRSLATKLAESPRFHEELTPEFIELMTKSAPLHDIGKITIPDEILLKPGKHTDEEFTIMKTHALRGYEILEQAGEVMGEKADFLECAKDIALYHHEKWDGSGYPHGLQKGDIPISARLMAVADVYDALRSERPYKKAFSHEETLTIIEQGRGGHFDPDIVDALLEISDELNQIVFNWPD